MPNYPPSEATLSYSGSFQDGIHLTTENPLEEIWSFLALYGSEEYLREKVTDAKNKDALADYVAVRIRQAIGLREAAREATLLTSPLTLYYSVLNLTRACMAIREEILESKHHGLIFKQDPQILLSRAKVTEGTFSQYLKTAGYAGKKGVQISLLDCLSRIIEISNEYSMVAGNPSCACSVWVEAWQSGKTVLHFYPDEVGGEQHFRARWEVEYPGLAPFCELESSGGCKLKIKADKEPNSQQDVASLCSQILEVNLIQTVQPKWFIVRQTNPDLAWPRPAYYFAALFILGNIVRYQPELMYQVTSTHSKWDWFFRRFMVAAERFFPHLMFNWIHKTVYFFG